MKTTIRSFPAIVFLTLLTSAPAFCQLTQEARRSQPMVVIADKDSGSITKNQLWESGFLSIKNNTSPPLSVSTFKMTIDCAGKLTVLENDRDGTITEPMRTAIYHADPGCKIYFEYIKAAGKNQGSSRFMPPLAFTITE